MGQKNSVLIDGEIDEARHRDATYEIYRVTQRQYLHKNMSLRRANNVLGNMLGGVPHGWRVIGITPNALRLFHEVEFRSRPKGVQRAHLFNRIETIKMLLSASELFSKEALFDTWQSRDKTILCLAKENRKINELEHCEIDNPDGRYFSNAYIGYSYSPSLEGKLLNSMWAASNLN